MKPWFAVGWQVGPTTGWGQFGAHFARTLTNAGYRVMLLAPPDPSGVLPMDLPLIKSLYDPQNHPKLMESEPGWLCMAIGNAMETRPEGLPEHVKVAGIIFCEDTGAIDPQKLNAYDVIVAGSRWTERVLKEKGVERVVLAHQGYDGQVFFPGQPRKPDGYLVRASAAVDLPAFGYGEVVGVSDTDAITTHHKPSRPLVFSGGKLEFRKGQDIVVEAFKRFRQTPEGKDAVLVTAWDNQWPQTMDGIWLSGYVKGVPTVKNGRAEVVPWLVQNGLPAESVIDCGRLSPPELAHVLRSCTVGIFPNRAESGTNLVLVEALASGLQCVVAKAHGHLDVLEKQTVCWITPAPRGSVPAGCQLYKSTEGWYEPDPEEAAHALKLSLEVAGLPLLAMDYWDWSVRGPAMAEVIIAAAILTPVEKSAKIDAMVATQVG